MSDLAIDPGAGLLTITGYAPLVVQSYSTAGELPLTVVTLPRLFPQQQVRVLNQDGTFTNEWYRYLAASLESSTTGVNSLDPVAVQNAIDDTRSATTQLEALTSAITAMAVQNAEALSATIVSVQAAAAPGAPSIPPVQPNLETGD